MVTQRNDGQESPTGSGGSHYPPIDPQLASSVDGKPYVHMRQDGDSGWDGGGGGAMASAQSYGSMEVVYDSGGFARDHVMGGPRGGHPAANDHPHSQQAQTRPIRRSLHPSLRPQDRSQKPPMSHQYPPHPSYNYLSPLQHSNTATYEAAHQDVQQGPSKRRRISSPAMQFQTDELSTNLRRRETYMNLPGPRPESSTPSRCHDQPPARNSSPNSYPATTTTTTNCYKQLSDYDLPYFNYSKAYLAADKLARENREFQHVAILDTLARVRGSDPPALNFDTSKALYERTLAQDARTYQSEMLRDQARSRDLLNGLRNEKVLGDVQFWTRAAGKFREIEGMPGFLGGGREKMGKSNKSSVSWDEYRA